MNQDFSLLDANIARVREGLRVLDEIARFVLRDGESFSRLKNIRHGIRSIEVLVGAATLVRSRQGIDVGEGRVVASEYNRASAWSLIRANANRVTESLRTLEEFLKIYVPESVETAESSRYELYRLEHQLLEQTPHFWLNYYFEQGIVYPLSDSVDELVWLIRHGAAVIQLRDKEGDNEQVYKKARYLCEIISKINKSVKLQNTAVTVIPTGATKERNGGISPIKPTARDSSTALIRASSFASLGMTMNAKVIIPNKILLILNDNVELAAQLPVAGVHLGQEDSAIHAARRKLGVNKIIGRSNHSVSDVKQSIKDGADYVSIGPVFATPTKPDRKAVGLNTVKELAEIATIPWLAIGGIDEENVNQVRRAGAKNVAVVRSARAFFKKG